MNFSLSAPGPAAAPPAAELPPRDRPVRRRGGLKTPLIVGVLVVVAGAVALGGVPSIRSSVAKLFAASQVDVIKYRVTRGTLPVIVNERGSLESSSNLDVTNTVEGMTTIIMILPEGTRVTKGTLVCELDSANLRDQLTTQEITTKRAFADLEQALKTREVAEIAVKEYLEGTYPQETESAQGNIKLAQAELVKARDRSDWSDKMLKIGYVTSSQNTADHLTLQKSEFSLREAQTKLHVLQKYTRDKQHKELQANVEKALSDELAKKATYELEKSKEEKLNKQIVACKLYAPGDGLVVYANEANRFGSNQPQIEEGASVRERQKIFSLPDISKMRVNTKVHESMVDRVRKGLKARIRVDAFAQQVLDGTVDNVQPLPDPTSFFASDVKVYTTLVTIDNPLGGLRPGMTAQVEILVTQLPDVLSIPVQAILEFKGKDYVYVARPDGEFVRKEIKLGTSNDKLVEVKDGLQAGEEVALSPSLLMTEAEKREAFAVSSKGDGGEGWSADAVKAGNAAPAGGGPDGKAKGKGGEGAEKGKGQRKGRGGAGGGMMGGDPAMRAIIEKIPAEDRRKVFTGTPEERAELLKKAGATDDQIQKMEEGMARMREMMQQGGGGFPGGGGPGGPGGGGGGGPQGGGPQ